MATYFIDFQGFYIGDDMIIKELCIMDANQVFSPVHNVYKSDFNWDSIPDDSKFINRSLTSHRHKLSWDEGMIEFCRTCILNNYTDKDFYNATFYVLGIDDCTKTTTLQRYFPDMRLICYSKQSELAKVPSNITCPWREHGEHCAYKNCLAMCIDYCKLY